MSALSRNQVNVLKQRLLEERQKLLDIVSAASQSSEIVELDQTRQGRLSRMDALQGQAMSRAMQGRRELQLKRIDAALQRIAQDEYGYCLRCEEEIALPRLEYDPAVTLCVRCAQQDS
ncbi:MAG: TraR/DksA family transcriptional regulator [Thioalkalispiraceae bacterium]|jgi:DnaK suppressor protein